MSDGMIVLTPTDQSEECTNCKFAIFQDTGYSNWTVEGTDFFCAKRLHPADGFDSFYETNPGLKYAAQCDSFEAGQSIDLDVDGEDYDKLTAEQVAIYTAWESAEVPAS